MVGLAVGVPVREGVPEEFDMASNVGWVVTASSSVCRRRSFREMVAFKLQCRLEIHGRARASRAGKDLQRRLDNFAVKVTE